MAWNASGRGAASIVYTAGNYSPTPTGEVKFSSNQLFPAEQTAYWNRLAEGTYAFGDSNRASRYTRDAEDLLSSGFDARFVCRGSTAGMVNKAQLKLRDGAGTPLAASGGVDFRTPGNGVLFNVDFSGVTGLGTAQGLAFGLHGLAGQTALTGETACVLGMRAQRSGAGLTFSNFGWGGASLAIYDNAATWVSAAAWEIFANLGVTHVLISLTQNDASDYASAYAALTRIMDKIKVYVPGMQFILMPTYDTSAAEAYPDLQDSLNTAYYDQSRARGDVLFLNLYRAMDRYRDTDVDGILGDHVHPTELGKYVVCTRLQGLLEAAAGASLSRATTSGVFVRR